MKAVMEMRAEALSQGTGSSSSSSAPGKSLEEISDSCTALPPLMSLMAHISLTKTQTFGFLQQKCAYFMVPKFVMPTQHNFCVLKEHISYLAQSNCCD